MATNRSWEMKAGSSLVVLLLWVLAGLSLLGAVATFIGMGDSDVLVACLASGITFAALSMILQKVNRLAEQMDWFVKDWMNVRKAEAPSAWKESHQDPHA